MRIIQVIDLLNKIARGTPPKKIKYSYYFDYYNIYTWRDKEYGYYNGLEDELIFDFTQLKNDVEIIEVNE